MINNALKQFVTVYKTANSSVKIFLHDVHILCWKCPQPAKTHAFGRCC